MQGLKSGNLRTHISSELPSSLAGCGFSARRIKGFGMHRGTGISPTEPSGIARYDKV